MEEKPIESGACAVSIIQFSEIDLAIQNGGHNGRPTKLTAVAFQWDTWSSSIYTWDHSCYSFCFHYEQEFE